MTEIERVHLIYPAGNAISTPSAIGRNLYHALKEHYSVILHDFDYGFRQIHPGPADALIGHWHPNPFSLFRLSAGKKGWQRIIALSPFCPDQTAWHNAFARNTIRDCDCYLAITGNFWMHQLHQSPFSHWQPKIIHLDLAVDRNDFPFIKKGFNKQGQRKFLYIGHTAWFKNTRFLEALAHRLPHMHFGWFGQGRPLKNIVSLGPADFSKEKFREIVKDYDFLLTVGSSDANPTTILEAMAWGIIPVCSKQSGYEEFSSIVNISINDINKAAHTLENLQIIPESDLIEMQKKNIHLLETHFNWQRFCSQVLNELKTKNSPALQHSSFQDNLRLLYGEIGSPYFWVRPKNLIRFLVANIKYRLPQKR